MHDRLLELTSSDVFSIVVAAEDEADALTLADAMNFRLTSRQPHARGVMLSFESERTRRWP